MKNLFPHFMYLILLFIPKFVSTTLFRPKGDPVWAIPEGEVINIMKKGCLQNIPSTIWILTKFISSYNNNINFHIHWNQHVWRPAYHISFKFQKKKFFWKSRHLYTEMAPLKLTSCLFSKRWFLCKKESFKRSDFDKCLF